MTALGRTIKVLRADRHWSMGQLAQRACVSKATIHLIESGKTQRPSAEIIGKLAKALDVRPDYLFQEAGWYTPKDNPALPPEVRRLAEVIEGYPSGPAKMQAKRMIVDVAIILETLRQRMEAAKEEPVSDGGTIV